MKTISRPIRLFWLLGVVVLIATTTGAILTLNPLAGAPKEKEKPAAALAALEPRVVCYGIYNVKGGTTNLYPLLPGRVTEVLVEENQEVSKGKVLLRLDSRLAKQRLRQAKADLEASKARLEAEKQVYKRKKDLEPANISKEEVNAAEQIVKATAASVDAKEAQLEEAQLALEECELKAPADGEILQVLASQGQVLSGQSLQPAIVFCPKGQRIVLAEVEQEFAGRVKTGQRVTIQDESSNSATWHGKVVRLSNWYARPRQQSQDAFRINNDVRVMECEVVLDEGQPPFRIGQRVRVTIPGN